MPRTDLPRRETVDGSRPSFSSVTLTIAADEAARLLELQDGDLNATETDAGTEFRTGDGTLVAVLTDRRLRDGSLGAELEFRDGSSDDDAARRGETLGRAVAPYAQ